VVVARLRTAYLSALVLIAALSTVRFINTHTALAELSASADAQTHARVVALGWTDAFIVSVIFLSLVAEGVLVFRPAVRTIRDQFALLEAARDRAAGEAEARTRFLAHMSHEIRTPLTAIIGYAQLAAEPGTDSAARADAVRAVSQNSAHLMGVISDVLDLARIDAEGVTIRRERISPISILDDTMIMFREHAAAKGVALSHEITMPAPMHIETDPVRLRQILVNLVGNAIKFTSAGSVTVRLGVVPTPAGTHTLRIEIVDTGIGMDADHVERLFHPFGQADEETRRVYGGTGLGLVISRKIARALGGDIVVASKPGEGTTVTLDTDPGELAGVRWCESTRELRQGAPASGVSRTQDIRLFGRVLVVDDFPDNLRLIALRLRKAGAQVAMAASGREAVEATEAARSAGAPFDLILMDMQMPEMDGPGATRALRERGFTTPIVALTANALGEHRAAFSEAGANDFLSKPFDTAKLVETCAAWIDRSRTIDHARLAA